MTIFLLTALLMIPIIGMAQYSEQELYNAYLRSDMELWKEYIEHTDWNTITSAEKTRLLNYQYGYVAFAISAKDKDAEKHLERFEHNIDNSTHLLDASTLSCYRSSFSAYKMSFNVFRKLMYANQAISLANEAMRLDSLNPAALTLKANIDLYCPKAFGGNKARALRYFLRAEQRYQELGLTRCNWNYRALQLCIAQCYEKTGYKEKAIQKCRSILQEEPAFSYIRDIYLPMLLGEKVIDKAGIGNVSNVANSML
ncbi:MAG: hypothetical protein NC038_06915 [Paludibacter sp.]|nr:hypothetical protein [Bacteroidales bacterium]MCM1069632.1 hypothetical protein [Prevotella sp.]MCM1354278.1 hypothetical protein [Bacteroides sp.]MCM1443117.1 hypothetical protein [Muribaculum sp.]MCM1482352.1 hypothetical protein [Paludibacter sp.]